MDTIPGNDPMENPPHPPLAGLNPADLLKQGVAEDTFVDGPPSSFHPPTVDELALVFPQFEILELIGKGGMGAVYKVRQKELDRIVALKILPPAIGETPGFSDRFTREAKALAKLNHPGIVTIHEFGSSSQLSTPNSQHLFYFLMEFVDGVNLAQLMRTGRLAPREALAIVPQICDALQFAHDQGIVHRDIKPENILLDRQGRVKVADFGIAKVVASVGDRPHPDEERRSQTDATLTGKILGTPQYMAPEQIDHPAEVDHRADIYALGVVFYQMLTGELPGKLLEAPSRKVRIDVRLDEIVLQAMDRNPKLRYQQASEMKTRVEGFGKSLPILLRNSLLKRTTVVAVMLILCFPIAMIAGFYRVNHPLCLYRIETQFSIANHSNAKLGPKFQGVVKTTGGLATLRESGTGIWTLAVDGVDKINSEERLGSIMAAFSSVARANPYVMEKRSISPEVLAVQAFLQAFEWLKIGSYVATLGVGIMILNRKRDAELIRSKAGSIGFVFLLVAVLCASLLIVLPGWGAFGWGVVSIAITAALIFGFFGLKSRSGRFVFGSAWLVVLTILHFGLWSFSSNQIKLSIPPYSSCIGTSETKSI